MTNPFLHLSAFDRSHLVYHLKNAERGKDIHRLLARETSEHSNAWFVVKDEHDDVASYLQDVALAWECAKQSYEASLSEKTAAGRNIGLQCRYALITTSVNSLVKNFPAPMLMELVAQSIWSAEQGLAYARQIPDVRDRSEVLITLFSYLSTQRQDKVLAEILKTIQRLDSDFEVCKALTGLAPLLPDHLLRQTWTFAIDLPITDKLERAKMLIAFIPFVPADERRGALQEAVVAVEQIRFEYDADAVIQKLAPYLSRPLEEQDLQRPEFQQMTEDEILPYRIYGLFDGAAEAHRTLQQKLLEQAFDLAKTLQDPQVLGRVCSMALMLLHQKLHGSLLDTVCRVIAEDDPTWAEAIATRQMPFYEMRVSAVLALHLSEPQRSEAFQSALTEVLANADPLGRVEQLAEVIPYLSEPLKTRAIEKAQEYIREAPTNFLELVERRVQKDTEKWVLALVKLAPHLPDAAKDEAIGRALTLARSVGHGVYRPDAGFMAVRTQAPVLVKMAGYLPEPLKDEIVQEALSQIQSLHGAEYKLIRSDILATVVPDLPQEFLRQALQIFQMIEDDPKEALTALSTSGDLVENFQESQKHEVQEPLLQASVTRHEDHDLQMTLDTIRTARDESHKAEMLISLIPQLPAPLLLEIQKIAQEFKDVDYQTMVLVEVACRIQPPLQETALKEALEAILRTFLQRRTVEEAYHRRIQAENLAKLAPRLTQWPLGALYSLWTNVLTHSISNTPPQITTTRSNLLAQLQGLRGVILKLGGTEATTETMQAIQDVTRWWP